MMGVSRIYGLAIGCAFLICCCYFAWKYGLPPERHSVAVYNSLTGKPIVDIPVVVTESDGTTRTIGRTDVRGKLFTEGYSMSVLRNATVSSKIYVVTDDPGKAPTINSIDLIVYVRFAKHIGVKD